MIRTTTALQKAFYRKPLCRKPLCRKPLTDYRKPLTDYRKPLTDYRKPLCRKRVGFLVAVWYNFSVHFDLVFDNKYLSGIL